MAEAKRVRRREKEAFLKTVFVSRQGTAEGVGTGKNWKKSGRRGDRCSPSRVGHPSDGGGRSSVPRTGVVPAGPLSGVDSEATTPGAVAVEEKIDYRARVRVHEEDVPGGNEGVLAEHSARNEQQQHQQQQTHDVATKAETEPGRKSGGHEERRLSQGELGRTTTTADAFGEETTNSSTGSQQQQLRRRRASTEGGGVEEATRGVGKIPRKLSKSSLLSPPPAPAAAAVSKGSKERAATPSPTVTSSVSVLDIGALQSLE